MEKKWFVIYTRPHQEIKISEQLSAMGIINYCPTIKILKQYSDRKKKVKKPLLSSYVMVNLKESERSKVFTCSGVIRYLFYLGKPAIVTSSEIRQMQDYLNGIYYNIKVSALSLGQMHKITQGPFSGISGRVVEKNKTKVKLELQSLGMSITLNKLAA
tara:strand:- start:249 stop:722 length:474 start_codon:yes stop_codon:yes gene_type:complete